MGLQISGAATLELKSDHFRAGDRFECILARAAPSQYH